MTLAGLWTTQNGTIGYLFSTLSCLVTVGLDDSKPGMIGCCFAALLVRSSLTFFFFFFSEAPGCVCKTGATKWDYAAYPTMGLYDNQQETMGLYGGGFNGIMSLFIMVITQSVPCRDLTLALGPCVRMRGSNSLADKGWLAVGNGIIGIFKWGTSLGFFFFHPFAFAVLRERFFFFLMWCCSLWARNVLESSCNIGSTVWPK